MTFMGCCLPPTAEAKRHGRSDALTDSVMRRIFRYAQQIDTTGRSNSTSYAYTKFQMRTNKRNATLMLVPTMYAVSHGAGRKFITEFYNRITVDEKGTPHICRQLNLSTIPHRRNTMTSVLNYMTPNVYGETLFQENIQRLHTPAQSLHLYSDYPSLPCLMEWPRFMPIRASRIPNW